MENTNIEETTQDTSTVESTESYEYTEDDALDAIMGTNDDAQESTQESNTEEVNQEQEQNTEVDLSDIDLTDFGISNEEVNPLAQEAANSIVQEQQPQATQGNETVELLKSIADKLNNPANQETQEEIAEEEASALKELFGKFEKLGLLPKGITEEQQELLNAAKEIKESQEAQKQQMELTQEFNTKVEALDSYSKQLESLIPGYKSDFMRQVVAQINAKNPQAGMKILNNPAELTNLWAKVGAKAQAKQQPTNVINTRSNPTNESPTNDLLRKIERGEATPEEEARLLSTL